jgi:hypothetical protein
MSRSVTTSKHIVAWIIPKIRDPAAADRWTWLIIAVRTQLRLARPLADDRACPGNAPRRKGG